MGEATHRATLPALQHTDPHIIAVFIVPNSSLMSSSSKPPDINRILSSGTRSTWPARITIHVRRRDTPYVRRLGSRSSLALIAPAGLTPTRASASPRRADGLLPYVGDATPPVLHRDHET